MKFPVKILVVFGKNIFIFSVATMLFILSSLVVHGQCVTVISTFPYHEDFELNDGGWISGGTNNDWAWGAPVKPVISGAGSGNKCWIIGGTVGSFYNFSERSYVVSPCFNFSALANPYISFKIFWDTENTYDGANLQYSINGGNTWLNVGAYGDQVDCMNDNWFNNSNIKNLTGLATIKNGWCGTVQPSGGGCAGGGGSGMWLIAKHTMPYLAGQPSVIFRFAFGAGFTCNGYDGFAFDDITIKNSTAPLTVTSVLQPAGCTVNNGSATLTVNGGVPAYNYLWNPNVSSSNNASGLSAGNYAVTVTDINGCSKIHSLVIGHTPAVTVTTHAYADTCSKGVGAAKVTVFSGTSPFTYLWSNAAITTSAINNLNVGSYTITVTDAEGCTTSKNLNIESVGDFTIHLGNDTTICSGNGFYLTPGKYAAYEWQDLSTDSELYVARQGIYSVKVVAANGCTASDTLAVVEDCLHDIILPNAFSPNQDGVNDIFKPETISVSIFAMNIFNRWGEIIFSSNAINKGWDGNFKSSKCEPGIYFWVADYSEDGIIYKEKKGTLFLLR